MADANWHDLGSTDDLAQTPLRQVVVGRTRLAVSYINGSFAVISGACNHAGGPLGNGHLVGDYVVCPWHNYKFHHLTGVGEPGYESDRVPRYDSKVEHGRLLVNLEASTTRSVQHHPHPLARKVERGPGPIRVVGISTTAMDEANPRPSTSERLLQAALEHAEANQCETKLIRLSALKFRACEGYYSKSAHACTWPCTITQLDESDQLDRVYEAMVHWADVVLVATPIRWGNASGLYYKMAERFNCVQNQITIRNRILIQNKGASFIVTGGQDNVQGVVGQLMMFFGELGMQFPQFPFIAHSRGWTAEDMERNVEVVKQSEELHDGARALLDRCLDLAERLQKSSAVEFKRAGRKASGLEQRNAR